MANNTPFVGNHQLYYTIRTLIQSFMKPGRTIKILFIQLTFFQKIFLIHNSIFTNSKWFSFLRVQRFVFQIKNNELLSFSFNLRLKFIW